jgi:hypothetical protein
MCSSPGRANPRSASYTCNDEQGGKKTAVLFFVKIVYIWKRSCVVRVILKQDQHVPVGRKVEITEFGTTERKEGERG